jgi:hypothetical protein
MDTKWQVDVLSIGRLFVHFQHSNARVLGQWVVFRSTAAYYSVSSATSEIGRVSRDGNGLRKEDVERRSRRKALGRVGGAGHGSYTRTNCRCTEPGKGESWQLDGQLITFIYFRIAAGGPEQ